MEDNIATVKVKNPIPIKKIEVSKPPTNGILPSYPNVFICAKKKTGKSTILSNIVQRLYKPNTMVFIWSPNVERDEIYVKLIKFLNDKHEKQILKERALEIRRLKREDPEFDPEDYDFGEIESPVHAFTSLNQKNDADDREPALDQLLEYFKCPDTSIEYIFIFDDLSHQLKDPRLQAIMKYNRHAHLNNFFISQWPHDLTPEQIKQLDACLLLAHHSDEKLLHIYEKCDLNIGFEKFQKIYHIATDKPYGFLYMDLENGKFYDKFESEFILPDYASAPKILDK